MTLPLSKPNTISEGSVLQQKPLHQLAKALIKSVDEFFKNGSPELEDAVLHGYKKGEYIYADVIFPNKWGGPKAITFVIYPSSEHNPDVKPDGHSAKAGGYFTTIDHGGTLGVWGKIVLHLDRYIPILHNYKPDVIPSGEYDIRDSKTRKKIYKYYKKYLYEFVYHEAQHAVKQFIYGWGGDKNLDKKYQKYHDQPSDLQGLSQYASIGDERESILAQIASEVESTIKFEKDRPQQLQTLTKTLITSPSFRRLVVSMLDSDAILKDAPSNKEFFKTFWTTGGKSKFLVNKFDPFNPNFFKYVKPKYHRLYKMVLKKLVDWWQIRFKKKPVKQEGSASAGAGMSTGGGGHFPQPSHLDIDSVADEMEMDQELKFRNDIWPFLNEDMTFKDLAQVSDPERANRSKTVRVKAIRVRSIDDYEAWTFSYKSNPSNSRTKNGVAPRWRGYVKFLKEDVESGEDAQEIPCHVDCTCPDYMYRWAYNNAQQNASVIGPKSWNGCINRSPKINLGQGLCKHLLALEGYLRTKIYNDEKKTNLTESSGMYEKFQKFVNENKEFDVPYDTEPLMNEYYIHGFTSNKSPSKFKIPENFDMYDEGSGWQAWAGGNDWENGNTAVCVYFGPRGYNKEMCRIWFHVLVPDGMTSNGDSLYEEQEKYNKWGKDAAKKFITQARKIRRESKHLVNPTLPNSWGYKKWEECFFEALSSEEMKKYVKESGIDQSIGFEEMKRSLNEGFVNNKNWFIYEGQKNIKVVFESGEQLSFDIDYKGNFGENREKWRRKAASTWKKLANEIHRDVEINEVGNKKETSWYECFLRSLQSDQMKQFKLTNETNKITFDLKKTGYENAPKVVAGVDPVNFTPRV